MHSVVIENRLKGQIIDMHQTNNGTKIGFRTVIHLIEAWLESDSE